MDQAHRILERERIGAHQRREFSETPDASRFKQPIFQVMVLFVDESESVARQLKRGREVLAHNEEVRRSGIGDLWELNGEAAFHVRVGHVDGYFGVRGGYNFVGSLNSSTVSVATGVSKSGHRSVTVKIGKPGIPAGDTMILAFSGDPRHGPALGAGGIITGPVPSCVSLPSAPSGGGGSG